MAHKVHNVRSKSKRGNSSTSKSCEHARQLDICPICEDPVDDSSNACDGHDAVFCNGVCQEWLHRRCAGLSKKALLIVSSSKCPFYCPHCRLSHLNDDLVSLKADFAALKAEKLILLLQLLPASPLPLFLPVLLVSPLLLLLLPLLISPLHKTCPRVKGNLIWFCSVLRSALRVLDTRAFLMIMTELLLSSLQLTLPFNLLVLETVIVWGGISLLCW